MSELTLGVLIFLILAAAFMFLSRRKSSQAGAAAGIFKETGTTSNVETKNSAYVDTQHLDSRHLDPHQIDLKPAEFPDSDQQILDQLREAGSNLSKPHAMEFYLYLPTQDYAEKVAAEIEGDGFNVEVKRAPENASWLCYVTKRMVPERAKISALGKRFTALAKKFDGEYDGWLTSVEK